MSLAIYVKCNRWYAASKCSEKRAWNKSTERETPKCRQVNFENENFCGKVIIKYVQQ